MRIWLALFLSQRLCDTLRLATSSPASIKCMQNTHVTMLSQDVSPAFLTPVSLSSKRCWLNACKTRKCQLSSQGTEQFSISPARIKKARLTMRSLMMRTSNREWFSVHTNNQKSQFIEVSTSDPIEISAACWQHTSQTVFDKFPGVLGLSFPNVDRNVVDKLVVLLNEFRASDMHPKDQIEWSVTAPRDSPDPIIIIDLTTQKHNESYRLPFNALQKEVFIFRMQRWVKRVIIGYFMKVCPFTQAVDFAATGLEKVGVRPGPIAYPTSDAKNLLAVISDLWAAIMRLQSKAEHEMSTALFLAPHFAQDDWDRFSKASKVIARTLTDLELESQVSVVFFHPFYARNSLEADPLHGHLPPVSMLRTMLVALYELDEVGTIEENGLEQNDFCRRAPMPMINLLRTQQVERAEQLTSGVKVYCANARRMASSVETSLYRSLAADMRACLEP